MSGPDPTSGATTAADHDLRTMSDAHLRQVVTELERRRPGALVASSGVRPRRRPWTYRDIWRLEAARSEVKRRGTLQPE
jgi:hypothetical protein